MFRSSLSATRLLRHGIKTQPTTMCLLPNRGVIAESTKFFATKGNDEPKVDRKAQALAIALKHIEKKHGKGSLMKLGDNPIRENVEVISTGSLVLDDAIGIGGLPKGRIVEIYGPESSGKTTIALHIVAEAQRMGGMATFIDSEHALDANYAKALGVNIDDLYLAQPDSGEQALEICDALVRSNAMSVVVVDSVAALTPRAEIEGEMGDPHMALQARLMSQALRKLTPNVSRSNCLLIFINQVRSKIGLVFGNPEVTSGGNALKFYSSVRIRVARDGTKTIQQDGQAIGCACKVKIVKNKMAPPFKEVRVNLMFGKGFSKENDLFELATTYGFIQRKGAWYTVETDTGEMKQFNGQASLVKSLEENKDFCEYLVAKVRQRMTMGSSDFKEDQVLEGNDEVTDTDGILNEIETGEVEEDAVTADPSKENGDATLEFGSAESIDEDVTKSDTNSSTSLEYDTRDTKISTDTSVTKEKAATKPKKRKGKKTTLTAAA